jgi:hypothetical protein
VNGKDAGVKKIDKAGRIGIGRDEFVGLDFNQVKLKLTDNKVFIDLT